MARCKWCNKRGLFLSVDSNGLCRDCEHLVVEVDSRARVLQDSMRLAHEGKTYGTRLSRCELAIEHAEFLLEFEQKGVPTISPSPSSILHEYQDLRTEIKVNEASDISKKAFEKADLATTAKSKERILATAVLKVREVGQGLEERSYVDSLERELRKEIHRVTFDGYLDAARKAEFKGNIKKAIDQYQEALFFIQNDNIDDARQQSEIRNLEAKLKELESK